jgi:hypothetical protein
MGFQKHNLHGFILWLIFVPLLFIWLSGALFRDFFAGNETLLVAASYIVGIIITIRYGTRPVSSFLTVGTLGGFAVAFILLAVITNNIQTEWLLAGGVWGAVVGWLVYNRRNVKQNVNEPESTEQE